MAETRLQFHPAAREEALAAYDWYSERNVDAAASFQLELENAGRSIENHPDVSVAYLNGTQKFVLKHFPFSIIYRKQMDRIVIVAVAHQRRRPGYWAERLESSDSG